MGMKILSTAERSNLERQLKRPKDYSERNRLCVILGYDDGVTIEELSKVLRLGLSTVYEYLREYDSNSKTKSDPRGGSDSKLSTDQTEMLLRHLEETTYLKVKQIIAYVSRQYGIVYTRSGMTDWLEQHGFVYKRPKKVPGKLDPEKQKAFIEYYEKLKKDLGPGKEIYFVDAVHPEHQSQPVCGWIKKGIQKTLQTSGKQLRLHFAGALNLQDMRIFTKEYETVDADAMIDFFKGLQAQSSADTIHVIMDNARANKNKKLDEFLQTSRIKVHYLPPYSPNLNPIERLWKIMREITVYNQYYESVVDFFKNVRDFFTEKIPQMTHSLQARINDKFQVIHPQPIKLGSTVKTI